MLIRLVKIEFHPDKVNDFLDFFETIKDRLRHQPGCIEVRLMKDLNHPNIFFSYSTWKDGSFLQQYIMSDFFKNQVWVHLKILFNAKPMAWSVEALDK